MIMVKGNLQGIEVYTHFKNNFCKFYEIYVYKHERLIDT